MCASSNALGSIVSALFLFASIYIYATLIRQISSRRASAIVGPARTFGVAEAALAIALVSLLLLNISAAFSRTSPVLLQTRDLVANFVLTFAIVLFIAAFLKLRGFELDALAGFSNIKFSRGLGMAVFLLIAAAPLLVVAEAIAERAFGTGANRQEIIELFNSSQTLTQRVLIIVLAVAVAPIAEEFIFRFFLYGVMKRYCGSFVALIVSAFLFGAAHGHLPSLAPLFVLGACFTLAYEWSGSIIVAMMMHSLFNSIQLTLLAFPQLSEQ